MMSNKRGYASGNRGHYIYEYEPEKHYKVFVVAIPQAIIDVYAVMIEFFDTLPAYHAMECPS
jgi:hypothetical protein